MIYTKTNWQNDVSLRSTALFNKREDAIHRMYNYRCAWMQGTTTFTGDLNWYTLSFGTYGTGKFYSSDGSPYTSYITNSGGDNQKVSGSASTIGKFSMVCATLIVEPTAKYVAENFHATLVVGNSPSRRIQKVGDICVIRSFGYVPTQIYAQCSAQVQYESQTSVKATLSVLLY